MDKQSHLVRRSDMVPPDQLSPNLVPDCDGVVDAHPEDRKAAKAAPKKKAAKAASKKEASTRRG